MELHMNWIQKITKQGLHRTVGDSAGWKNILDTESI